MAQFSFANAVHYHYNGFPPTAMDYGRLVHALVRATEALARYDQMLRNMHNSEILLGPLRSQEAVISSRIEGTISTIDEILEYEAEADGDDTRATAYRTDVFETVLYQRTLKRAQKALEDGYTLSASFIRSLHQQLLSFGRGANKAPGAFKHEQNYLADGAKAVRFVPIRPEQLAGGLEAMFRYLEEGTDPVLIKTAVMHLEFEALHPFQDGNGCIGRMLIPLYLWHTNIISAPHFYISGYFEEHKDEYIDGMRAVSASGNWDAWCLFFLEAVEQQAVRNLRVAESIQALYGEMKATFAAKLSSRWSVAALDFLFTYPVFRNNKFTASSGIPGPTASRFTRALLEDGLIIQRQAASGRRPALYSFEPLMRLVRV